MNKTTHTISVILSVWISMVLFSPVGEVRAASPLSVTQTSPASYARAVSRSAVISAGFNMPVNGATLSVANIVIEGAHSGKHGGTVTLVGDTAFTFNPDADFGYGELVKVALTVNIRSTSDSALTRGFHWEFWTEAAAANGEYSLSSTVVVGTTPRAVVAGDFDLDGDLDLAAVNQSSNTVSILKNNGSGTYALSSSISVGGAPSAIVAGDLDHDGDMDLAVVCSNFSTVVILKNGGSGSFTQTSTPGVGVNPQSIAVADLDNDGDLDLAVSNFGEHTVTILRNAGSGSFSASTSPDVGGLAIAVVLGDYDGDGDFDLVVESYGGAGAYYKAALLRNNGLGVFSAPSVTDLGAYPKSAAPGDFDGDGYLDLAVTRDGNTIIFYVNDGTGALSESSTYSMTSAPSAVSVCDVDGDGILDVAVTSENASSVTILKNSGSGSFTLLSAVAIPSNSSSVLSGDVDGDGDLDLVTANLNTGSLSVLKDNFIAPPAASVRSVSPSQNQLGVPKGANVIIVFDGAMNTSTLHSASINVWGAQSGTHVGTIAVVGDTMVIFDPLADFSNGEAVFVDLANTILNLSGDALAHGFHFTFQVQSRGGTGNFTQSSAVALSSPVLIAVGDLDGDGYPDIVAPTSNGSQISVFRNLGDGTFSSFWWTSISGGPSGVTLGDFDRDGDLDVAVTASDPQRVLILKNNGSGSFTITSSLAMAGQPEIAVTGDFDGDGDLDVVVVGPFGAQVVLLANDGNGTFTQRSVTYPGLMTNMPVPGVGDFDGDGDLDLAVPSAESKAMILLNDGAGNFSVTRTATLAGSPNAIRAGDFDGDGYVDLATANAFSNAVSILKNDGQATFSQFSITGLAGTDPGDLAVGDFESDGDLDVFAVTRGLPADTASSVLTNDGSGNFALHPLGMVASRRFSAVTADVDGDGDLDLLTTNVSADNIETLKNQDAVTAITGTKFRDLNNNHAKDLGEIGVPNWCIELSGAKTDSVWTNGNGEFSFTNLSPGTYTVSERQQSGWNQTFPDSGTYTMTLSSGQIATGRDFGNHYFLGSISGTAFHDVNGNGERKAGEPGLAWWKIRLSGPEADSAVSGVNGEYTFAALFPGTYTVQEDPQPGWFQTTSPPDPIVLSSALNDTGVNFGNARRGSIGGTVFNDADGNGVRRTGEPGLTSWKLTIDGTRTDTVLTDSIGAYVFTDLPSGSYTVRENFRVGWVRTEPDSASYAIALGLEQMLGGVDFGNYDSTTNYIGGMVFNDANANGAKDTADAGIEGWKIVLLKDGAPIDSALTAADGYFGFQNLPSGSYGLKEGLVAGWSQSYPPAGEYTSIALSGGTIVTGMNFGTYPRSFICGTEFFDKNGDGVRDAGEPGLLNWRIHLRGQRVDSVLTDAEGGFCFQDLSLGTYTVSVDQQSSWEQTRPASPGVYILEISEAGQNYTAVEFGSKPRDRVKLKLSVVGTSGARNLYFGVRAGASYGIWGVSPQATGLDSVEGEFELPPPQASTFDARFVDLRIDGAAFGSGSWTDVRSFGNVSQIDTFQLAVKAGAGGYPIVITWAGDSMASAYTGPVTLSDNLGYTYDMKQVDSVAIADPSVDTLIVIASKPSSALLFRKGWNVISIPVNVPDGRKSVLFPGVSSMAFSFQNGPGYQVQDSLDPGNGFWLKFPEAVQSLSLSGSIRNSDTIPLLADWNLIGSLSSSLPTSDISTIPAGIIQGSFFGFDRGYHVATVLEPYYGYWVKASQAGQMVMNSTGSFYRPASTGITLAQELTRASRIEFTDALDGRQVLYFARGGSFASADMGGLELPPVPPAGVFDARFESGQIMVSSVDEPGGVSPISIHAGEYPMTISWHVAPEDMPAMLIIGKRSLPLRDDGSTCLLSPTTKIAIEMPVTRSLPERFSLAQNYPNPFNPLTTIRYQLPVDSRVTLKIYNVLGQNVRTVLDAVESAGFKAVHWDGSHVASGVYFYRLEAASVSDPLSTFTQVKRMLMIK